MGASSPDGRDESEARRTANTEGGDHDRRDRDDRKRRVRGQSGVEHAEPSVRAERPHPLVLGVADAVLYTLVVTSIVIVLAAAVSFPTGLGWVGVKYLLFVIGVFLLGVASIRLRPRAAWRDGDPIVEDREATRFRGLLERLPPLRGHALGPDERLSPPAKLLMASLVVLAVSFLMERWLGVTI